MTIQLVRLNPAVEEELADGEEYHEAIVQEEWTRMAGAVQRVIGHTLASAPESIDALHWERRR